MRMDKPDLAGETDRDIIEAVEKFHRWYDYASLKDQAAWHRQKEVELCLKCRGMMANPVCDAFLREYSRKTLRGAQIDLLRIRIWRTTGVCPGEG